MAVVPISHEVLIKQFQIYARCQGENASHVAEIVNGLYDADTVTANDVQFWFRRFRLGTIYYELFPYGQTLNSQLYCQQLDRLKLAIDQKWPELANRRGVVFHQDNARPNTSVVTRQKLWELVLKPSPCQHNGNEVDDWTGLDEWNSWFKSETRTGAKIL
ncbi:mariner transposase [Trichonephila clavipes]|uniref:Mariner transposase n=1 Tax=Trichonephila clavipes TaxID=2585209 RepID=A0A8X6WIX5_TRICX|nr:mariner transposase [Trichonephila clavipes]